MIDFIKYNHTLGNFIPVPFESGGGSFNVSRYKPTNDFWDLTLYYIYCWYKKNEDLYKLLGKNSKNVERCIEWLKAFGSWDEFVERNFLQPFVLELKPNQDGSKYGIPKLLWCNDDNDKKYPNDWGKIEKLSQDDMKDFWEKRIPKNEKTPKNEKRIPKNECVDIVACEQYFKNATACIKARTQLMIKAMIEAIENKPNLKWEKLEKWIMHESQL